MKEILVLAEHRRGEIRDVTFEMLTIGRKIASRLDASLTAAILGYKIEELCNKIAEIQESAPDIKCSSSQWRG